MFPSIAKPRRVVLLHHRYNLSIRPISPINNKRVLGFIFRKLRSSHHLSSPCSSHFRFQFFNDIAKWGPFPHVFRYFLSNLNLSSLAQFLLNVTGRTFVVSNQNPSSVGFYPLLTRILRIVHAKDVLRLNSTFSADSILFFLSVFFYFRGYLLVRHHASQAQHSATIIIRVYKFFFFLNSDPKQIWTLSQVVNLHDSKNKNSHNSEKTN